MTATFSAPTASLDALSAKLARLTTEGQREIAEVLSEDVRTLVVEGFEGSRSGDGDAWVERSPAFDHGGKLMLVNGRFMGSFETDPQPGEVRVGSNFIGARLLTEGGTVVPKTAKALAIPMVSSVTVFGARGQRLRRPRTNVTTIFAKQATIPARPVFPTASDGGPIWGPRLRETAEGFLEVVLS